MAPTVSVVIPTRNERAAVPRLVQEVRAALAGLDYELVFVDDSTDGTDALLAGLARDDARVLVHHRRDGHGLASAVVEGIRRSRGQAVAVLDADLQHPPALLPAMLARLETEGADVVVASRYLPGACAPGLSRARRGISLLLRLLAQALLRGARRSTDPLSGFFVVRRAVVEGVRLRPVLMTTVTTVLGLLPVALGLGEGGELQAPLARSVLGGLLLSTLVTLVFIPTLYVSVEEFRARVRQRRARRAERIPARRPLPGSGAGTDAPADPAVGGRR